jgi:tRNA threonylcarbamoyladenosine biosynthesis protein TsaB
MSGYWLAIDTATDSASVAAGRAPLAETSAQVRGARRHSPEIIPLVDFALGGLGLKAADLAGIVVGDGPGSFTGLRIGWAAAKGLAQEAALELRAIPSLMAAAAGVGFTLGSAPVAACFDALRGQVYGALYAFHPDRVDTLLAPTVATLDELARLAPVRPRIAVGDGAIRYAAAVTRWTGADPVGPEVLPNSASLMLALLGRTDAARTVTDPAGGEPVYGRPAAAQTHWEARHGRPLPDSSRRES